MQGDWFEFCYENRQEEADAGEGVCGYQNAEADKGNYQNIIESLQLPPKAVPLRPP